MGELGPHPNVLGKEWFGNYRTSMLALVFSLLISASAYGAVLQSTEDRVLRLEATVKALAEDGVASGDGADEMHSVTGLYIERPEVTAGTS